MIPHLVTISIRFAEQRLAGVVAVDVGVVEGRDALCDAHVDLAARGRSARVSAVAQAPAAVGDTAQFDVVVQADALHGGVGLVMVGVAPSARSSAMSLAPSQRSL
jgi:hypothetical protein